MSKLTEEQKQLAHKIGTYWGHAEADLYRDQNPFDYSPRGEWARGTYEGDIPESLSRDFGSDDDETYDEYVSNVEEPRDEFESLIDDAASAAWDSYFESENKIAVVENAAAEFNRGGWGDLDSRGGSVEVETTLTLTFDDGTVVKTGDPEEALTAIRTRMRSRR